MDTTHCKTCKEPFMKHMKAEYYSGNCYVCYMSAIIKAMRSKISDREEI